MLMLESVGVLALMGGFFGSVLAVASKKFEVETDERIPEILQVLPGANCGACGFPGCGGLAEAIVEGAAKPNACVVAKADVAEAIAQIMGQVVEASEERKVARIKCSCAVQDATKIYEYKGISDCHLAVNLFKGPRNCNFGCFGMGSCARVCPFGAISMNADGLPEINYDLCTGCGVCVDDCPQFLLYLEKISQEVFIGCNNLDRGKPAKDVCSKACISCGICVKMCPEGAIKMNTYKNGGTLPSIDSSKCTQCGTCAERCPSKCIKIYAPIQGQTPILPPTQKTGCASCGACAGH